MKHIAALCLLSLVSCSTQYTKTPSGQVVLNNNLMSKGTLKIGADGSIEMSGDSEAAAHELGNYGKILSNATLVKAGINAAQSVGNNAVDAIK